MRRQLVRTLATAGIAVIAVGATAFSAGPAGAVGAPKPGAPTGLTGNGYFDTSTQLSWTAPASTGGLPVTGYQLAGPWGAPGGVCSVVAPITTCMPNNLIDSKTYNFKVRPGNANGVGPYSAVLTLKAGLPDPPTAVKGTGGNGSVAVSWTAPVHNGAFITGFNVVASPGGATCVSTGGPACTVSGLTNGSPYTFTVTSVNQWGVSLPSAASSAVTPATVPGTPTALQVTALSSSGALVNFTAPLAIGLSAITGYTVVGYDNTTHQSKQYAAAVAVATVGSVPGTGLTVTGLHATDSYTFAVFATNAKGSSPLTSLVVAYPAAPTSVSGSSNHDGTAGVTWAAATVTLGDPVTGYAVSSTDSTMSTPGPSAAAGPSATAAILAGLNGGDAYQVCVTTLQAPLAAAGDAVSCSTFTETVLPGAPTAAAATSNENAQSTVSWSAPAFTGGSAVTGYAVTPYIGASAQPTVVVGIVTSTVIGGLTNGTACTVTVAAINAVGTGPASIASAAATPATVPGAPTGVTASGDISGTGALVNFTAPASDGGSAITGYTLVVSDTTTSTTTTYLAPTSAASSGYDVTGLAVGDTYTFSINATNAVGNSAASTPVGGTPAGPTSVTPVGDGLGGATVSWTASPWTFGTTVTGFSISTFDLTASSVGPSAGPLSTDTSAALSGLTVGDNYMVCVAAQSALPTQTKTCVSMVA